MTRGARRVSANMEARVVAEQAALMRKAADDCDCDSFHEGAKALRMGAQMLENIHTEAQRIVAEMVELRRTTAQEMVELRRTTTQEVQLVQAANRRLTADAVTALNEARFQKGRLSTFIFECNDMRERFNNLLVGL